MTSRGMTPRVVRHRLGYILFHSDMSLIELVMSWAYFGWAALLLWLRPNLFVESASFDHFSNVMPQVAWGVTIITIGLLKFFGVLLMIRWFRLAGALMGTTLWAYVCASFWGSTGMVIYGLFTAICFFTVMRHARIGKNREIEQVY